MPIEVQGLAPLLQVFDMPTSIRFYRDKLGFQVIGGDNKPEDQCDWVLLSLNGTQLMLNTAYEADERPPAPDPARIASHSDTEINFGCPDVDAAYAHLRSKDLEVEEPKITPYGFKRLLFSDPDGYCLCFHWPAK